MYCLYSSPNSSIRAGSSYTVTALTMYTAITPDHKACPAVCMRERGGEREGEKESEREREKVSGNEGSSEIKKVCVKEMCLTI